MPTPPLRDEVLIETVAAFREYGSQGKASLVLDISRATLQNRLKVAAARGFLLQDEGGTFEVKSRTVTTDAGGALIRQSVRTAKAPGSQWEAPAGHTVKGYSTLLDGEGRTTAQWVKTQATGPDPVDIAEAVKAAFAGWEHRADATPAPVCDADLATIHVISDAHIGLLCAVEEVGVAWDTKRAQRVLGEAVTRLVAASPPSKVGVVLGLGDLLHADGYDHRTPQSKNALDVDGRYPLILKVATRLIISAVTEALTKHETVIVRLLAGNHDKESCVAVALALSLHYEPEPRVVVDDDPSKFWWWSFGTNFIGATHGDTIKMRDLPLVMASLNPEAWGRSKFRSILTGHIHHQSAIEVGGVTVESFQAPVPSDHYHHSAGYVSGRSLNSITLHREHGEIGRNKVRIVADA